MPVLVLCLWLVLLALLRPIGTAAPQRDGGAFVTVGTIEGLELGLDLGAGRRSLLTAREASLRAPALGPLRIGVGVRELGLDGVELRIDDPPLRCRAAAAVLTGDRLELRGGVRLDEASGSGLLFSDSLDFALDSGLLRTGAVAVLAPEGATGGFGGQAVPGFEVTLDELLARVR